MDEHGAAGSFVRTSAGRSHFRVAVSHWRPLSQEYGSPFRPRGRHGARSTWTIRDRLDAIDRRHVTAQESARRSGASYSIIPPPSGRIGAALSRLIVAGRRACMWSAMAAPGRGAPARQSIGCRSQSGEPPRPCARAKQRSPDPCPCRAPSRHPLIAESGIGPTRKLGRPRGRQAPLVKLPEGRAEIQAAPR